MATLASPFHYQIVASNNPTTFSATGLPPGLTLDKNLGLINGTPLSLGSSTITLGATNASGTGVATLILTTKSDIAKGIDVSSLQQMAVVPAPTRPPSPPNVNQPFQFYDTNGQALDPDPVNNCLMILKKRGIDLVRLRVFVPPIVSSNWDNQLSGNCTIEQMVPVAKKAHDLGIRVYMDLHCSWTFADPANQRIPVNWAKEIVGMSHDQAVTTLSNEVSKHVTDVLTQLQNVGVTPEFLSIGNEITNGLLTQVQNNVATDNKVSSGISGRGADLASFLNAGYYAVKAIDPNIKVVIQIDRDHDDGISRGFFDDLKRNGGHWDISGPDCDGGHLSDIAYTMNDCATRYNTPGQGGDGVMMTEFEPPNMFDDRGRFNPNPNIDLITSYQNLIRAVPGGKGLGTVFWEAIDDPEWRGYAKSAFANHEPTSVLDAYKPCILGADGTTIVGEGNQPLQLKGVNLGGWMVMEPGISPTDSSGLPDEFSIIQTLDRNFGVSAEQSLVQKYRQSWITTQDLDAIKAQGLNLVRVPVWWGDFYTLDQEGAANPVMRSDAFSILDWLVSAASQRGIYVIIDMHGVFGGQSSSENTGYAGQNQYWSNATDQANTQSMWAAIAAHYNGNLTIAGYDLLNEPLGAPGNAMGAAGFNQAVVTQLSRLYTAVRTVDPKHLIFMQSTGGWNALPNPSVLGWHNVVYEMHDYTPTNTSDLSVKAGADQQVADFVNYKALYNVPLYIGEFSAYGNDSPTWQYMVDDFNRAGISWSAWNYKGVPASGSSDRSLYVSTNKVTAEPNLKSDSFNTINSDWSNWVTTNAFAPSAILASAVIGSASITSPSQMTVKSGSPFSYTITASAVVTSLVATNLPVGVSFDPIKGVISGTIPVFYGVDPGHNPNKYFNILLGASTTAGSCTGNLRLEITPTDPLPVITSATKASGVVGQKFTYTVTALNNFYGYTATTLPSWLSLHGNILSGTPPAVGTTNVQLNSFNPWGSGSAILTITVTAVAPPAPVITSRTTDVATTGTPYTYTIAASNSPTSFSATSLPPGLTVNPGTGVISGTPTAVGISSILLSARNSGGTGQGTLTLTVGQSDYNSWIASFGMHGLSTLPAATPFHDGVPNLLKFVLGINPTAPMNAADRTALPQGGWDETSTPNTTYLTLTFGPSPAATGLSLEVQLSTDLQTWKKAIPTTDYIEQPTGKSDGHGDPYMQIKVPVSGAAKKFIRLSIPSPQPAVNVPSSIYA